MTVIINNTVDSSWISIFFSELTVDNESEIHIPITRFSKLRKLTIDGIEGLELSFFNTDRKIVFNLSNASSLTNFIKVTTVNGLVPSSLDNLRNRIMALFDTGGLL